MNFNTQFNQMVYKDKLEVNDGMSKVEKAGYIPAQKRIENMMLAGQRLVESRRSIYDFTHDQELDENFFDPTRKKDFDMADATQMKMSVDQSLKASQNAQEKRSKEQINRNDENYTNAFETTFPKE